MINFKHNEFYQSCINFTYFSNKCENRTFLIEKPKYCAILSPKIKIPENINVFKQLNIIEKQHSKIIGDLLNPKAKHGYASIFLDVFFKMVLNDSDFFTDEKDKWILSIERERYDIRIRNQINSKIIILENKSNNAEDKPNQLYRYWYNGIYQIQRKHISIPTYKKILYIGPGNWKKPDYQTIMRPNDYDNNLPMFIPDGILKTVYFNKEILMWLHTCKKLVDGNMEMCYYINQYIDFWRT